MRFLSPHREYVPKEFELMDGMEKILVNLMDVIAKVMPAATAIIGALGLLYAIILGSKYASAGNPEELQKVKQQIKNAIIGIFLLFILYWAMYPFILEVMLPWVKANADRMAIAAF